MIVCHHVGASGNPWLLRGAVGGCYTITLFSSPEPNRITFYCPNASTERLPNAIQACQLLPSASTAVTPPHASSGRPALDICGSRTCFKASQRHLIVPHQSPLTSVGLHRPNGSWKLLRLFLGGKGSCCRKVSTPILAGLATPLEQGTIHVLEGTHGWQRSFLSEVILCTGSGSLTA